MKKTLPRTNQARPAKGAHKRKGMSLRKNQGPTNGAIADWIKRHASSSEEVHSFCKSNNLTREAHLMATLASKTFKRCRVQVEGDPEGSSMWLAIEVDIPGPLDAALAAYHRFWDMCLPRIPVPKRHLIRLVYNIV